MNARRTTGPHGSDGPHLGWNPHTHAFRLLAPLASHVTLILRSHPEAAESELVHAMAPFTHPHGPAWQVTVPHPLRYYRFRVTQGGSTFDIADPRSTSVARQFSAGHPTWSVAHVSTFDWQGDVRPGLAVHEAVILELHVRDFTVHPSSGVRHPGTYLGLAESVPGARGGVAALRNLGVDCVELLPVTSFPLIEPPPPDGGYVNPTARNHWGYMPSFFFAASERYSHAGVDPQPDAWIGVDADGTFHDPGDELREAVRLLHRDGIAVVLDLVFNHVSIHDDNPLLRLDPGSWFHRENGHLRSHSGCGNDLDTRDPAMSALVVDAAVHWMRHYHVDGLRLDLAAILDDRTLAHLRSATRDEYPRAILISEPWSMGGYRPGDLARLGHTVWNDKFRNAIKGQNPHDGKGFIFGEGQGGSSRHDVGALLAGWPRSLGGLFDDASLSLNYLESHDDLTLGDFVRLALNQVRPGEQTTRAAVVRLDESALRIHRLAATALLLSRGAVMIAQGQEWARAKLLRAPGQSLGADALGWLDGNSYNRDDDTNHLDWQEATHNAELVDHYRRLIAIRRSWLMPAFLAGRDMRLVWGNGPWAVGYHVDTPRGPMAVLCNGGHAPAWFELSGGPWWILLGPDDGHIVPTRDGVSVRVAATAAVVLYATGPASRG